MSATPDRPLLVFDGDCAFCTTWVNRLRDALPVFPTAVPWQWEDLDALGLTRDDVTDFAWFVSRRHSYAGAAAFSMLLRGQPRIGLRFAGWVLATPPFSLLAALAYNFVAKYRHRLPGGTPACAMPRPE
ncbi:MAG TPA: DCC1-like thiol-disulfide oxidoreductase family protein [Pseudolysinimonas sp.]|nr:DCC1-like thiol-disulfide oxidoreductase family protein [Pseudolysinimonas sp.]